VLVNVHFLNNQILYNDHRRQKNVACFYEQHFWISIHLYLSVRLFKNILIKWSDKFIYPENQFFSIIYSEYVNFLIRIKHMKEGCSVGISSTKIHHKQQSSAKNTLNYVQKSTYVWTSWVLPGHIYILLCIYTKETLGTVTIIEDKAD